MFCLFLCAAPITFTIHLEQLFIGLTSRTTSLLCGEERVQWNSILPQRIYFLRDPFIHLSLRSYWHTEWVLCHWWASLLCVYVLNISRGFKKQRGRDYVDLVSESICVWSIFRCSFSHWLSLNSADLIHSLWELSFDHISWWVRTSAEVLTRAAMSRVLTQPTASCKVAQSSSSSSWTPHRYPRRAQPT